MKRSAEEFVEEALAIASSGASKDLPIAAIVVDADGRVISAAKNSVSEQADFAGHAEITALRQLVPIHEKHSARDITLIVTLEPCPMCAWAIRLFGIGKLVFGAYNNNYGAAGSVFDLLRDTRYGQPVEVFGGVLAEQCEKLLGDSFKKIRNNRGW